MRLEVRISCSVPEIDGNTIGLLEYALLYLKDAVEVMHANAIFVISCLG